MPETEIRERPIIFSGEMVRAIIEGRKTMTRRVVKPQPEHGVCGCGYSGSGFGIEDMEGACTCKPILSPYGKPGDRIWVREKHYLEPGAGPEHFGSEDWIVYAADEPGTLNGGPDESVPWRPSIHMPRWASRILLEIVSVRVERLQEITEEDAKAEGIPFDGDYWRSVVHPIKGTLKCWPTVTEAFKQLWDSINAKNCHGWDENPWVWVVEFKVLDPKGVTP